jgi:hypothetical protein
MTLSPASLGSVRFDIFVCDVVFAVDASDPNDIDTIRTVVLDRDTCSGSRGKNYLL